MKVTNIHFSDSTSSLCKNSSNFSKQESVEASLQLASSHSWYSCHPKSGDTAGDRAGERNTVIGG